jgi:hypothetical protein
VHSVDTTALHLVVVATVAWVAPLDPMVVWHTLVVPVPLAVLWSTWSGTAAASGPTSVCRRTQSNRSAERDSYHPLGRALRTRPP